LRRPRALDDDGLASGVGLFATLTTLAAAFLQARLREVEQTPSTVYTEV